jgi:hypothetical protein
MLKSGLRYFAPRVALVLTVGLLVWLLAAGIKVRLLDFENYLAATRILARGGNPYGTVEFFAPPWLALLLLPLASLPTAISAAFWLLFLFACIGGVVIVSLRWLGRDSKVQRLVFPTLIPLLMPGVLYSYVTGQISPLVNLAIILAAWKIDTSTSVWLPALSLLLVTLKPHIVALPTILCLLELSRRHRWRLLGITLGGFAVLCVLAFLWLPNWLPSLIRAWVEGKYKGGELGLLSPGYTGLPELGIPFWIFLPLTAYTLWQWWQTGLAPRTFALALVTNLLVIPYSRSYDLVVLILPLLSLAEFERRRDWAIFGLGLTGAFILPFTVLSVLAPVFLAIALLLTGPKPLSAEQQ